jgi:hypothetical protein
MSVKTRLSRSRFEAQSGPQSAFRPLDCGPAGAICDLLSLLTLRPGLILSTSLFVGGLALAIGLAVAPAPARAMATTPSAPRLGEALRPSPLSKAHRRVEGPVLSGLASLTVNSAEGGPVRSVGGQGDAAIRSADVVTTYVYLPFIAKAEVCQPIPDESYGDLPVDGDPTDPPAEEHPDLNLSLRGYEPTDVYTGLVDYSGGSDPNAPQLPGLFADDRTATFSAVYQVYGWDWENNRRGALVTEPEVTLAGLAVTPGETIHVPNSGYTIGDGYEVLVLYATPYSITLKYTPEDHVIEGYTLHVENVCVEPRLLALYQSWNEAGRSHLPALRAGQAFGRARGSEIGVVIRDRGAFMDPRSRKDWWQGR